MTTNLTVCSNCGSDYDTIDSAIDGPRQALRQECPECGEQHDIAIVNYPSGSYSVIGPAIESDTCSYCNSTALYRMQRLGNSVDGRCSEHVRGHEEATIRFRSALG